MNLDRGWRCCWRRRRFNTANAGRDMNFEPRMNPDGHGFQAQGLAGTGLRGADGIARKRAPTGRD